MTSAFEFGRRNPRLHLCAIVTAVGALALASCSSSGGGSTSSSPPSSTTSVSSSSMSSDSSTSASADSSSPTGPVSSGGQTAPVQTGKTLTWALADTPRTLFAPTNFSSTGSLVMSLIQGRMLNFDTKGALQPSIATATKVVSPTEYQYTIGDGNRFSDGSPVTAADVAYSLNLHLDPKIASQEASLMTSVKSASAKGNTVTVTLSKPDSLWQYLPAALTGYVYEKKSVEANTATYGTPQTLPVASGPYQVTEYVPDSRIVLDRNPYYSGAQTQFDKITFQIIPDDQTRLLALQSGKIDGTFDVPASGFQKWSSLATVQSIPELRWRGLTMDMTQKPFNDIHVRRALYYATDRAGITAGLTPGLAKVSTTINDPAIFAGALDQPAIDDGYAKIATFDYDVAKAKSELAQSSVPQGFETTMNVPADSAVIAKIAQVVVQNWAAIGVKLKLNLMPGGPRFQVILDHGPNLGVQIIGNTPDAPDPVELVTQYFDSSQAAKGGNNSSNLKDPAIDALIRKAQATTDAKTQAQLTLQAQALASQQVPVIPILWGDSAMAVKKAWSADAPGAFYSSTVWINVLRTN